MAEKKKATDNQNLVDSKIIASLFGVTTRRVQQMVTEGIITAVKKGNANKYDLLPTIQKYIRYLSEKVNRRDGSSEQRRSEAEADLKRSKADIAALQLQELEGMMHRSEDVEAITTDLVFTIRSMIMALPGRLAVDTCNAKTPAEASEIIRSEVFKILEELANYKYNPDEYARRVRKREGWNNLVSEEEQEE